MLRFPSLLWLWAALPVLLTAQTPPAYQYFRVGSPQDVAAKTTPGYALMGGGTDLDEAFRWLCGHAGGGDFLVLRGAGTDAYNPYIAGLEDGKSCKLNSVATLILPSREAASDPFVTAAIDHAEAIFIAGGDQANYIRFWMGTPAQAAINAAIQRGVPLGGTSAGLAVMGEWAYSAEGDKPDDPNLDSKTALANPLGPRITLVHGFVQIPALQGIITDTHFASRDRTGRLLAFLFRLNQPDSKETPPPSFPIRGVGVQEKTAVLLEPDGKARVVGEGAAYFIQQTLAAVVPKAGDPLTGLKATVQKARADDNFNLRTWQGGLRYEVTIRNGQVLSTQPGGAIY